MTTTDLAKSCGATVYTNRTSPHSPAVAFGDEAWAKFSAEIYRLEAELTYLAGSVLFAVQESIVNGACPFSIIVEYEDYQDWLKEQK